MKIEVFYVCPECAHEWQASESSEAEGDKQTIKDANGNVLNDGDTITVIKDLKVKGSSSLWNRAKNTCHVIKDLKVKGSSSVVKVGTKVKNIRLVEGDHDIDCKINGIGAMKLKSVFVKKV